MEIKNKLDQFNGSIVGISTDMLQGWSFNNLKQELLLFDAVGMLGLDSMVEMYQDYPEIYQDYPDEYRQSLQDIEYLLEKDVLFNAFPADFFPKFKEVEDVNRLRRKSGLDKKCIDKFTIEDDINLKAFSLRCSAIHHNLKDKLPTIPVVQPTMFHNDVSLSESNAAQVVINSFPCLDKCQLSFKDILDLRSEKEMIQHRVSLRRWIRKIGKEELNRFEIKDELDFLLNSYTEYMKLMKLKYDLGSFHSLVNVCAGAVENLAKLKLKELSNDLFSIGNRKVALTEAELKAPGRELAYIHLVREKI